MSSTFLFVYHGGGMPETPEEGERAMAAWQAWMDGVGDAMVDSGNPVGMSKTVGVDGVTDNGGANPTSGYTIVRADGIDAACEIAKGCPILEGGKGTIEVAEIIQM
ncbi:YciI family protein [Roseovarius sp. M141]|uniref:YciI family protein n=1 Tax=Roseovarius sp. M141 TaxID=2583806 RepID=UPI0020CD828C|nr:YciI family protein [Roseovarius sp. M141]MCQ0094049.1 hypothetical protein [Roseovarius sp. M141]